MFADKIPSVKDSDNECEERLLAEEEGMLWIGDDEGNSYSTYTILLLWVLGLYIIFMAGALFGFFWRGDLNGLCSQHISQYCELQSFNGSLVKENIFRQDASPEVDAAWDSLGINYRSVRVTSKDAEESGLAPDQVKIKPRYGGGYPATVEGLHHLQCLSSSDFEQNLLRQSLYYNHDYYHSQGGGTFSNNDQILRYHVFVYKAHCLDVLRQQLMCTVDTGLLGQVWIYPDNPEPYHDFSSQHKCKNFEKIRRWAQINQLPEDLPTDFLAPMPGDTIYQEMP
ncbi:hypothetical protein N7478_006698 [Penicillium angulare]|uniref:uncharacterized protein n=1 Tax=Penicillium angulare TaxID=116970 RepID=UPI0025418D20|nr:uncharacterized protein N7478_006698 [Penicillium angulare]KAJ5281326.1 hypothetical protein N7478_006698 [Penicillium angulare]